jgi:hypothetical protein
MKLDELPNELLISSYLDAVRCRLGNDFIELLFNEIERRKIQHLVIDNITNF